jgi:hypothetical protein
VLAQFAVNPYTPRAGLFAGDRPAYLSVFLGMSGGALICQLGPVLPHRPDGRAALTAPFE